MNSYVLQKPKEGFNFMKKTVKRLAALGLTVTSVMGLVACGSDDNKQTETQTKKEVTKPGKFKVMVDNTVLAEGNGGEEFYDAIAKHTGLDIEWVRPDHNNYYKNVSLAFTAKDTMPDVVLVSSDYYAQFASQGLLWDMSDAWANSETKNSGRLISSAQNVLDALVVANPDGGKAMYGFSPYRGNGCCTFVSVDWLEAAGYKKSDVEGKTLTFKQYYEMLTKMKNSGKVTKYGVVSAPGFISAEAPYTNYLPEFYQKANYTFYYDEKAKAYVDGFSAQEMKDALSRLATAYKDGILDTNAVTDNTTSKYREKFFKGENGLYTYWAGTWANTTVTKLKGNGLSTDIVYLEPIAELGKYVERIAPAWCITSKAENPEGIFKFFIDAMLDGGDVQTDWTYGAEGTCWSVKGETYKIGDAEKTAEEGVFHFLQQKTATSAYSKNHIDPILSLAAFKADYKVGNQTGDPGAAAMTEIAKKNGTWFAGVSQVAVALPMTEELSDNIGAINDARNEVISLVIQGKMSVDDGMKQYESKVGAKVKTVVDSLNALKK